MRSLLFAFLVLLSIITLSCSSTAPPQISTQPSNKPPGSSITKTGSPTATTNTAKLDSNLSRAKDWYDLALKEAQKWQSDAKMMELHAYNTSTSLRVESIEKLVISGLKEAPMNGTSETWEYYFISKNAETPYQVVISQGKINKSKVASMFLPRKYETMKEYSDWLVDSPEAAQIAKSKVIEDLSGGAFITYALFNGENNKVTIGEVKYINRFRWQISIQPFKKTTTVVQIDGTTREILETDVLK
jgi:hypothetical protein